MHTELVRECNGGIQRVYRFSNGWGASVVRHSFSYGHERGLWELAVLKCDGDPNKWESWHLNYDHPESHGDVRGCLTETDVDIILESIKSGGKYLD